MERVVATARFCMSSLQVGRQHSTSRSRVVATRRVPPQWGGSGLALHERLVSDAGALGTGVARNVQRLIEASGGVGIGNGRRTNSGAHCPQELVRVPAMSNDRDALVALLQRLIRIDSRNPGLDPDGPGELELARFVDDLLDSWGWDTAIWDLGGRRANVIARWAGAGAGPSLMINVHLDTVGVAGMQDPFAGEFRDGKVFGRGSQDTKGGMAAVLTMARAIAEERFRLAGELVLAFVADEEHLSIGTEALLGRVRTDAAIVIEPSDLAVVIGHRGFGIFRVETTGKMAHGGRPDLGVDANLHMAQVLVELDRLRQDWSTRHAHPTLGPASLHVPVLSGGRHLFVYADSCHADVECRSIPGQGRDEVHGELQAALDRARQSVVGLEATVEAMMWRPPHEIDPRRPVVRAALAAVEEVTGRAARVAHHAWWEDSGLLGEAGIDAVVLGPTGGGLHAEVEWVDVDSIVHLTEIHRRTAVGYCGLQQS